MRLCIRGLVLPVLLAGPALAEDAPLDVGAKAPEPAGEAAFSAAGFHLLRAVDFPVGSAGGYALDITRDGATIGIGGRYGDLVLVAPGASQSAPRRSVHPYNNAVESF